MDFLTNRYKNNDVYKNLYSDYELSKTEENDFLEKPNIKTEIEKTKELEEKLKLAKKEIKSEMLNETIKAEPFFDDEFFFKFYF